MAMPGLGKQTPEKERDMAIPKEVLDQLIAKVKPDRLLAFLPQKKHRQSRGLHGMMCPAASKGAGHDFPRPFSTRLFDDNPGP